MLLYRSDFHVAIACLESIAQRYRLLAAQAKEDSRYADGPAYSQDMQRYSSYCGQAYECERAIIVLKQAMPREGQGVELKQAA